MSSEVIGFGPSISCLSFLPVRVLSFTSYISFFIFHFPSFLSPLFYFILELEFICCNFKPETFSLVKIQPGLET